MKTNERKSLMIGQPMGARPVTEWSDEQRRLGGAWAAHEIASQRDPLTAEYDWIPAWTCLTSIDIYEQLGEYYDRQAS